MGTPTVHRAYTGRVRGIRDRATDLSAVLTCRAAAAAALVSLCGGAATAQDLPYAGQQQRAIAALSETDVAELLAGRGWGLAKPAELNGWPGPAHVLELADDLSLDPEQRAAVQAVFDAMQAQAQRIGAAYVASEAALDTAFAGDVLSAEELGQRVAEAEALRAELRAVHLAAHLETRPLLSRHQVVTYNRLRGYDAEDGHGGQHGGH